SRITDDWRNSLMTSGGLSDRTMHTLRHFGLEQEYYDRPVEAFGRLRSLTVDHPEPEQLFALAEVSYDLGRKADDRPDAVFLYYLSAGFAYRYVTAMGQPSNSSASSLESGKATQT